MFRVSCIQLRSNNNIHSNLDKSFGNVKLSGAYVPSFDCNWNFASSIMK